MSALFEVNKCNKQRCITQATIWPWSWGPFRLLANCFLLFCSDLAVLIFLTLLADIHNLKTALGPHPVGEVTYSSCPSILYFHTA